MKVAIDAGHGMSNKQKGVYDPGATHVENGFRHEEASIALKYALALRDVFHARGVDVFMTRDDAEDHAPLGKRASNAAAAGCDRFVSIHLNDFEDDAANGLEVLYGKANSKTLAASMQKALVAETGLRDRKVKLREDLAVLKFAGPAVLIELGFIANDGDREALLNVLVRDKICRAIAETIATA